MGRRRDGEEETLEARVTRWRVEQGGRGVRWPDELWAEAIAAARAEGVGCVAQRLGIARDRLAARIARSSRGSRASKARPAAVAAVTEFVEVDTRRLASSPMTAAIVRFEADDGKKMELEIRDAASIDIVGLFQAFWSHGR